MFYEVMTHPASMRTAEQCLAKAADMDRLATATASASGRADLRLMARRWRELACKARWQDAHTAG